MPAKGYTQLYSNTRLAAARYSAGMTQTELARRMGLSIATYQRLEEGQMTNPPLGYLVNAAIVLKVAVADLVEPEWRTWTDFGGTGADTPSGRRRRVRWK